MSVSRFTRIDIDAGAGMDSIDVEVEVEVDVNEALTGRVHPGVGVIAALDPFPATTIPGAVIAVAPTADPEKATVKVRIGLQQKGPRILPGTPVKVTFLEDGQETWTETAAHNQEFAA